VAVGTDLFEVMISGLYGTATCTFKGRTELVAAMSLYIFVRMVQGAKQEIAMKKARQ
jgi:hypothetical protein